jgi:hypothetical protein
MATVVLSVVLLLAGLVLVYFNAQAVDLLRSVGLPNDLQRQLVTLVGERYIAYALMAASPILLIIGSLVKGI